MNGRDRSGGRRTDFAPSRSSLGCLGRRLQLVLKSLRRVIIDDDVSVLTGAVRRSRWALDAALYRTIWWSQFVWR